MTYKKQLRREIMELTCTIKHIQGGNDVVIERVYNLWGITIQDLINERNDLVMTYNRKYGKRFGALALIS